MQTVLSRFKPGARPPILRDHGNLGDDSPTYYFGRSCAKCGRKIGSGGLLVVGVRFCCGNRFQQDGRQ